MSTLVSQLMAKRWATIAVPRLASAAKAAAPAWRGFFASANKGVEGSRPGELAGYFGLGAERAVGSGAPDPKEFYQLYDPANLPEPLRDVTTPLFELACETARTIANELFVEGLTTFRPRYDRPAAHLLRIISYPASLASFGAAPHTDITLFTLALFQEPQGLRISPSPELVAQRDNDVLVLPGDMLAWASGGKVKAAEHCAAALPEPRLAMVFFANPPDRTRLRPGLTARAALRKRLREMERHAE